MKSDYKKSMLRLGAVVVASASMLGSASIANAALAASPLLPAEDAGEATEPTLQELNQTAYENDYMKLIGLEEKLTETINSLKEKYPEFSGDGALVLAHAISQKIDAMKVACEDELERVNAEEDANYVSPLTDTEEQDIENAINNIPVEAENNRILTNEQAFADYNAELQKIRDELAKATAATQPYAKFLDRGKVEAVENEIDILADDAQDYFDEVKLDGWFDLNVSDSASGIRGQIARIVANAKAAYEKDRVEQNTVAYNACIDEINALQTKLDEATAETQPYANYINRGAVEAIQSAIDELKDEADTEKENVETEGFFGLKIEDSANAIEGQINEVVRKAQNATAYSGVSNAIDALEAQAKAAFDNKEEYFPFIPEETIAKINKEIEDLAAEAEYQKRATADSGEFDAASLQATATAIGEEIDAAVKEAKNKAYDEKLRLAKNEEAYKNYMDGVQELRDELAAATAEDVTYYEFINWGLAESIESEIGILADEAETEFENVQKEGLFNLSIKDSAIQIRGAINNLIKNAKDAQETSRVEANKAAYGAVYTALSELGQKISVELSGSEPYQNAPYMDVALLESLYKEVEKLVADADEANEATEEEGLFADKFNYDNYNAKVKEIEGTLNRAIEKAQQAYEKVRVKNNKEAYQAYMDTVAELNQKLKDATDETQPYAKFINRGVAEEIANEIDVLKTDGEKYYLGVAEAGVFDISIEDDAVMIEGKINAMVAKAKAALEGDRKTQNNEMNNVWLDAIKLLENNFKEAFADDTYYYPFLSQKKVASIKKDIDDLKAERQSNWDQCVDEEDYYFPELGNKAKDIQAQIDELVASADELFNVDRVDKNTKAYNACIAIIDALRAELAEAVNPELPGHEYVQYLDRALNTKVTGEIDELVDEIELEKTNTKEKGFFGLNIDDSANAIRGQIQAAVDEAKKIAADPNGYFNNEAYAYDVNMLKQMQEDYTALWESLQQTSPEFYESEYGQKMAENIYNELAEMRVKVDAAWEAVEGDKDAIYDSPIPENFEETFAESCSALQHMAQVFADNHAAMMADQNKVNALDDEVFELGDELETIDPEWLENEKAEALGNEIRNMVEALRSEIEGAYAASMKTAEYVSPITEEDLGAVKAKMEELRAMVEQTFHNNVSYANDVNRLKQMHEDLTALWETFAQSSPSFYESNYGQAMAQGVYQILADAHEAVENEYASVEEGGYYVSPLTEAFDQDFEDGVANLQHMAQVFADNYAAMQEDAKAAEELYQESTKLGDELDGIDPNWMDNEAANELWNEISSTVDSYQNEVNGAYQASLKTGEYIAPFDQADLDAVKAKMDDLRAMVEQTVYNNAAYGQDKNKLFEMQQDLTALWETFKQSSPDFYDSAYGQALAQNVYQLLADMDAAVDEVYATVEEGGHYVSPITEAFEQDFEEGVANLQHMAQVFVDNNAAMLADNEAVDALDTEVFELGDKLDALDPDWMEIEEAAALGDEIRAMVKGLRSEIEGAYAASMKTGEYISPIDEADFADVREVMTKLYDLVKAKVAADNKAYNEAAFGAEFSLLGSLQELLSNTWNELVDAYYGFEEFGAAIALRTNLYNDLEAKANACEEEHDRVAEEGTYAPQIPYTFEQEILDGIEQLQALAEQYGTAWNEFQANGNTLLELMDMMNQYEAQLDSEVPGWDENEAAMDLRGEIWGALNGMFNENNAAWQAFNKTGEYISPFDEEDITAVIVKMDEFYGFALQVKVSTLDAIDADAEYYTIDGQKLSRPVRGIVNIVRKGDKVQKIFIK